MFYTISLDLTNGLTDDQRETLYIRINQGGSGWALFVAWETNAGGWSVSRAGDNSEIAARQGKKTIDEPRFWFYETKEAITEMAGNLAGIENLERFFQEEGEWITRLEPADFSAEHWDTHSN